MERGKIAEFISAFPWGVSRVAGTFLFLEYQRKHCLAQVLGLEGGLQDPVITAWPCLRQRRKDRRGGVGGRSQGPPHRTAAKGSESVPAGATVQVCVNYWKGDLPPRVSTQSHETAPTAEWLATQESAILMITVVYKEYKSALAGVAQWIEC